MTITIKAKFDSKCLVCNDTVHAGETVLWERGVGVTHEGCVDQEKYLWDGKAWTATEFGAYIVKNAAEKTGADPEEMIEVVGEKALAQLGKSGLESRGAEILTNENNVSEVHETKQEVTEEVTEEVIQANVIVELRNWLAQANGSPAIMKGDIVRETDRGIYFRGTGHINTSNCCVCGRALTNETSVLSGIGPVCSDKVGIPRDVSHLSSEDIEAIKERLSMEMKWEGWLPKGRITIKEGA